MNDTPRQSTSSSSTTATPLPSTSSSTPPNVGPSKRAKKPFNPSKQTQASSNDVVAPSPAAGTVKLANVEGLGKMELEKLHLKREKQKKQRKLKQERKLQQAADAAEAPNAEMAAAAVKANDKPLAPLASVQASIVPASSPLLAASTSSNSSSTTTLASALSRPVSRAMTSNTAPTEVIHDDDDNDEKEESTLDWAADDAEDEDDTRPKVSIANIVSEVMKDGNALDASEQEKKAALLRAAKRQEKNKRKREKKQELLLAQKKEAEKAKMEVGETKGVAVQQEQPKSNSMTTSSSSVEPKKANNNTQKIQATVQAPTGMTKGKKETKQTATPLLQANPNPAARSSSSFLPPFFSFTVPPTVPDLFNEPGSRSLLAGPSGSSESLTLRISLKPLPELRSLPLSNTTKRRNLRDSNGVKEVNMKRDARKFRVQEGEMKISRWRVDDGQISILSDGKMEKPVVKIPSRPEKGKGKMVTKEEKKASVPLESSKSETKLLEVASEGKKEGLPRVSSAPPATVLPSSPFVSALERVSSSSSHHLPSSTEYSGIPQIAASTTSTAPSTAIPTPPASTSSASQPIRPIVIGETTFYTSSPKDTLKQLTITGLHDDPAVISTGMGRKEDPFVPAEEVRRRMIGMGHGRTASTAVIDHPELEQKREQQVLQEEKKQPVIMNKQEMYPSYYQQQQQQQERYYGQQQQIYDQPRYDSYPQYQQISMLQQDPFYGPDGGLYVLNEYKQAIPYYSYTSAPSQHQSVEHYYPNHSMHIQAPIPLPPHMHHPSTLANKFMRSNIQPYDSPPISPHQPSLPPSQGSFNHPPASYPLSVMSASSSSHSLHLHHPALNQLQGQSTTSSSSTPAPTQQINDNGTVYFLPAYAPSAHNQNEYYGEFGYQQGYQGPVRSLHEYEAVHGSNGAEWNGGMYGGTYVGPAAQGGEMYQY